jgi:hypothetical protein
MFYSSNSGSTWTTLSSGTATNPPAGSSNTYTYQLVDNLSDVTPNLQNQYRFVVTGTNTTYSTSFASTDNTTSVYGPENITITTTGKSYNSVDLNWTNTAAPNAQKYLVYFKLSTDVSYTFSKVIANTSTTIDSLLSSTAYNFKVVPITGVSNTYKGYRGNDSNVLTVTTDAPAVPTQLTSPTITGTGYAFTSINGTSGTYQSGTYQSKTTHIGITTSATTPTSGGTSALAIAGSAPYKITQYDVSNPSYYFYYVDAVTANDGSTVYYYYSSAILGKVGNLEDDYTRTVTGGLGYMTPIWDNTMSPNSYSYNLSASGSTWSVNGSVAVNASSVTGSDPYTYPQQSIELGGKTNIISSVNFPSGADGLGLVFWAASSGSWWASRVYRTVATGTKYTYGITEEGSYTYYLGNRDVATSTNKYLSDSICSAYYKNRTVISYTCNQAGCSSNGDGTCSRYVSGVGFVLCSNPATSSTTYVCDQTGGDSINNCGTYTYSCTICTTSGSGSFCGTESGTTTVCDVSGGSNCGPYSGTTSSCNGSNSQINNPTYPSGACNTSSSSVTLYSTALNILMANGSTVSSQASQTIESSVESPTAVLGIKVITSGNTITSRGYSNTGLTSQIGSDLSYTPSSPTKTSITGSSHAGIIKTPPGSSGGIHFDNLKIV